ncbi:MAG: hypothetical protein KatS3mg129_3180 [Leptospiraceae bacterium]|nr:MAG: hypothetical protein KatS3mg129_3180 [Leptospiraceae bacterium]
MIAYFLFNCIEDRGPFSSHLIAIYYYFPHKAQELTQLNNLTYYLFINNTSNTLTLIKYPNLECRNEEHIVEPQATIPPSTKIAILAKSNSSIELVGRKCFRTEPAPINDTTKRWFICNINDSNIDCSYE